MKLPKGYGGDMPAPPIGGIPLLVGIARMGLYDTRYDSGIPDEALPMTGRFSMMRVSWNGPENGIVPIPEIQYICAPDMFDCFPWPLERLDAVDGMPQGTIPFRRKSAGGMIQRLG